MVTPRGPSRFEPATSEFSDKDRNHSTTETRHVFCFVTVLVYPVTPIFVDKVTACSGGDLFYGFTRFIICISVYCIIEWSALVKEIVIPLFSLKLLKKPRFYITIYVPINFKLCTSSALKYLEDYR